MHPFVEKLSFLEIFCLKMLKASSISAYGWRDRPPELSVGVKT